MPTKFEERSYEPHVNLGIDFLSILREIARHILEIFGVALINFDHLEKL